MVNEVYRTLGEAPKTKTEEEILDGCWLNGGMALIRAFIEAKAKDHGFENVKLSQPHVGYPRMDLTISFNSISQEKNADKVRVPHRERNLRSFERDILKAVGRLDKNLIHNRPQGEEIYTVPLSRDMVSPVARAIKLEMAEKIPTSAYIAQLKR